MKKEDIMRQGYKLEYIWECEFDLLVPTISHICTPDIPEILKTRQTENDIITGIKLGKLFGFIVCTITSSPNVIKKFSQFPPIIKRLKITDQHLTPFMTTQVKLEKPNLKTFERETLVQCFNAKNHLLLTTLAKYYLDSGLIISNITQFIQYIPKKALLPFVEHVTKMRIDAEKNDQTMKGNTAKVYGNAGYGKVN